jgi:hypothetical protein
MTGADGTGTLERVIGTSYDFGRNSSFILD